MAVAFSSCRKDVDLFITDTPEVFHSSIFGIVVDESGDPVDKAVIKYGDLTKVTDENGIYQFKNVKVNSKHNFVTITKNGYFEGSRTFTTDRSNTISLKNILLEKSFDVSFESTTSASLKKGSIKIGRAHV